MNEHGHVKNVSIPTITVFLPPKEKRNGRAIIVCPGGGYGTIDWNTHAVNAANYFNPRGVAVIGLKYRTNWSPKMISREKIQHLALLDAQRAVRTVRRHAPEWGIDPRQIGVAGYSAGANLTMNLAANFDAGNAQAADPIERESCRPDFAIGCSTWHWRQKESPFVFHKDSPPVLLVHATNDGVPNKDGDIGGAPIELPLAIAADLEKRGVPVYLAIFDEGGHGVGNLTPQRVQSGYAPAKWPEQMLHWLDGLSQRVRNLPEKKP